MDAPSTRCPNPVRLHRTLRIHEVDLHRRLGCRRYEECLERSAKHQWLSFTCVRCFAFRPRLEEADTWSLEEALRYLAAGRGNRIYPNVEWWLAVQCAPDRTQL